MHFNSARMARAKKRDFRGKKTWDKVFSHCTCHEFNVSRDWAEHKTCYIIKILNVLRMENNLL